MNMITYAKSNWNKIETRLTTDFNQVLRKKSWPSTFSVIAGFKFQIFNIKNVVTNEWTLSNHVFGFQVLFIWKLPRGNSNRTPKNGLRHLYFLTMIMAWLFFTTKSNSRAYISYKLMTNGFSFYRTSTIVAFDSKWSKYLIKTLI